MLITKLLKYYLILLSKEKCIIEVRTDYNTVQAAGYKPNVQLEKGKDMPKCLQLLSHRGRTRPTVLFLFFFACIVSVISKSCFSYMSLKYRPRYETNDVYDP